MELPRLPGLSQPTSGFGTPRPRYIDPIEAELRNPEPRPEVIKSHLKELVSAGNSVPRAALDQLTGLLAKGPTSIVAMEPSSPNLMIRMPTEPARRSIAEFVVNHKLKPALAAQVDRDALILMPLLISKDAKALGDKIEPGRQALRGVLGSVTHGDFDVLDAQMFTKLRGKTLVLVGHVVDRAGQLSFEIRNGEARRYLPLKSLERAAADIGFNLIPLGCETGEAFAVGTAAKITDVDGVAAFSRAISRTGRTSYLELLNDLASENVRLVIDPQTPGSNLIPIELIDKDGTSVQRPAGAASVPPSGIQPRNNPSLNALLDGPGFSLITCEVSATGLSWSLLYHRALALGRLVLPFLFAALLVLFVIIGSVEATLNDRRRPRQTLPHSNMRQLVLRNTGNSELAASIYDGLALAAALALLSAVYWYFTVSWMTNVVLDPNNIVRQGQPMNVFVFILLLVPILYLVVPYPIQKTMLRVPRSAQIVVACFGIVLLLGQPGSAFFAAFGVAVTTVLVGIPFVLYRGTMDQHHKFSAGVLLAIACLLVATVMLGWSWTAATAGCLLVEPHPI